MAGCSVINNASGTERQIAGDFAAQRSKLQQQPGNDVLGQ
jgi:hypothetical protein